MPVLEDTFPGLASSDYRVTSPETPGYNCIAWAAGDTARWWWPDAFGLAYWPSAAPREESLKAFVKAFEMLGYEICPDAALEPHFEKIAIFAIGEQPKHVARQLPAGGWTSKLGRGVDIEHIPECLECELYGVIANVMKRPLNVVDRK